MSKTTTIEAGLKALDRGCYPEAIDILEAFCQSCTPDSREYLRAKMHLVKAYEQDGQLEQAIKLCQQLTASANAPVQIWAEKVVKDLSSPENNPESNPESNPENTTELTQAIDRPIAASLSLNQAHSAQSHSARLHADSKPRWKAMTGVKLAIAGAVENLAPLIKRGK